MRHNSGRDTVTSAAFARDLRERYLRDWMYGATIGAVTTFVIVAAVAGADLPPTVALVLGAVVLFAKGFVLAAWRYLSTKRSLDNYLGPPAQAALNTFAAFICAVLCR